MKKNVVILMVDQMRADCLGYDGNDMISTPNLNMLAHEGAMFEHAYTAVPSCIASRASFLTGLKPENHGRVGYEEHLDWNYSTSLANEFAKEGYYTKCIGKMHVYPERKLMGFHHIELHDGYLHSARNTNELFKHQYTSTDDYLEWFKLLKGHDKDLIDDGLDCNSWVAREWMYEEELHPTNWVVTRGIDFLRTRDTTQPFLLNLSFVRPHSPLNPPKYYFDMYYDEIKEMDLPSIGNWIKERNFDIDAYSTVAKVGKLNPRDLRRAIAAYYGCITHIDHQIGRFLMALEEHQLLQNTIIVFLSDHGDQLGEHNILRKAYPYQGSIRIPLIVKNVPELYGKIPYIVEIRDLFPTLVDVACGRKVEGIDGISFKNIIEEKGIHDYIHGEHFFNEESHHFIVDENWKYIWHCYTNSEQLFHLANDPKELENVVEKYPEITSKYREILVSEISNREEGFVENGKLVVPKSYGPTLRFLKEKSKI